MRKQPQPPHQPPLPAGLLLRGRQQRHPLLRSRRHLQIQLRERGQDHALLRNPQLLGDPAEEGQDQVQLLRPPRGLRLRRWPSVDGFSWAVTFWPQSSRP